MLTPTSLLISQILAHIGLLWMIFNGSWIQWVVVLCVLFLNGCLGMTMTYHRLLSHRSWSIPKPIERLFVIFATIGLTGSAISWVSIHRKHHRYTDQLQDPHSPKHKSWFYCHFLSMYSKVEPKYAMDLLKDKFYVIQHRYYFIFSLVWAILMVLIFQDPYAVMYAWLAPAAILWNTGSAIVSISHRHGAVYNDTVLALLVWGEGYHAAHHANPGASRFGKYDLGGILIEFIKKITKSKQ